jgi:hypothetical protein
MKLFRFPANAGVVALIALAMVWLAAIGGWIANIVKIFAAAGDAITGWFIFRCIGVVVAPLGAILGYL